MKNKVITESEFCELYNSFTGESGIMSGIDKASQLKKHTFTGEELMEFAQHCVDSLYSGGVSEEKKHEVLQDFTKKLERHGFYEQRDPEFNMIVQRHFWDLLDRSPLSAKSEQISEGEIEKVFAKFSNHENSDGDFFLNEDDFKAAIKELNKKP